jgi:hypothetical protein
VPSTVTAKCHRGERIAFGGFDWGITEDNAAYLSELRTVTVPGGGEEHLVAECGRGEQLAFGGYSANVTLDDEFVPLHGLARTGPRSWQASARNDNSSTPGNLTAFAYCAKKKR